ncbi:MAG TPA: hypothetical protein VMH81_31240, partial [Bryobacteraceae bacterium]|nr:hypothetical protein [Bryobacteraceae bacterium]
SIVPMPKTADRSRLAFVLPGYVADLRKDARYALRMLAAAPGLAAAALSLGLAIAVAASA